jgi:hypothetical protein
MREYPMLRMIIIMIKNDEGVYHKTPMIRIHPKSLRYVKRVYRCDIQKQDVFHMTKGPMPAPGSSPRRDYPYPES